MANLRVSAESPDSGYNKNISSRRQGGKSKRRARRKESKGGSSEKRNRSVSTGNRAQRDSNTQFSNYRN